MVLAWAQNTQVRRSKYSLDSIPDENNKISRSSWSRAPERPSANHWYPVFLFKH